jgi:AcrR family transcriptional regulator
MKRKKLTLSKISPKQAILDAVVNYFLKEGFQDKSIRSIGKKIGVSHRMINYHFRTVPQFWTEVVKAVSDKSRQNFAQMVKHLSTFDDPIIEHHRVMMDKKMLASFRLDIEVTLMSLDDPKRLKLIKEMNETWLEFGIKYIDKITGTQSPENRILARLTFSSIRGMLIDHMVFGNPLESIAAMQLFADMLEFMRKAKKKC